MASNQKLYWKDLTLLASIKILIHVIVNSNSIFGLHRDEYLYLAEGDHLAWGFMEVPPLTPFIGWVTKGLLGSSEVAVRFPTALLGAISILVIGMMVREMGGKRIAQAVAGIGFLLSPVFLGSNNLFQPVSINQFWWLLLAYFSVKVIKEGWNQHWISIGIVTGFAILTKYSVVFFIVALLGGLVLTRDRRLLMDKHLLYSMALALLISAPNIFW